MQSTASLKLRCAVDFGGRWSSTTVAYPKSPTTKRRSSFPRGNELRRFVVGDFGYATVVDDHRPPKSTAHLSFKDAVLCISSLVGDVHAVSDPESNGKQRRQCMRVSVWPQRNLKQSAECRLSLPIKPTR